MSLERISFRWETCPECEGKGIRGKIVFGKSDFCEICKGQGRICGGLYDRHMAGKLEKGQPRHFMLGGEDT